MRHFACALRPKLRLKRVRDRKHLLQRRQGVSVKKCHLGSCALVASGSRGRVVRLSRGDPRAHNVQKRCHDEGAAKSDRRGVAEGRGQVRNRPCLVQRSGRSGAPGFGQKAD